MKGLRFDAAPFLFVTHSCSSCSALSEPHQYLSIPDDKKHHPVILSRALIHGS
jgi:hypothetical protein